MAEQEPRRRQTSADAEEAALTEYRQTHRRLSDRVERLVMQLVILGLVGLVLVQMLAVNPDVRRKLNLLEGTDGYVLQNDSSWWESLAPGARDRAVAGVAAPAAGTYAITIQLDQVKSAPGAKLVVGGRAVADFSSGQATAQVRPGELVLIDATGDGRTLTFRVGGNGGLALPALNAEVTTRGNQASLGVASKTAP